MNDHPDNPQQTPGAREAAIDSAIEIITAHLVHGEVSADGWKMVLEELVATHRTLHLHA